MSNCCCNNRYGCIGVSIVVSIIVGIIGAFLTFTTAITLTPAFLWVVFGIAVLFLAITYAQSVFTGEGLGRSCVCAGLITLLIGIIGTVITALILLGITFAATSVIGAIIAGILIAFFLLVLLSAGCLVLCRTGCDRG